MRGFSAILRKELTQMFRDRTTLVFALAVPVFELILFGVIDMNPKNVPTAVFDQSRTQQSRQLIADFQNTALMRVTVYVQSRKELERAIVAGETQVAIEIPPDYARNLSANRQAHVLVLIDGSDSSVASQALAAANGAVLQKNVRALLGSAEPRIEVHPLMMFNPDMRSANLLIPGLIAILLTFSATVLSAFAIVKERERGTLEQLMVTPVSPLAVVTGKLLPYLALAYIQLLLVLSLMNLLFRVPINGSVLLLLTLSPLYLIALVSIGLLVSSRATSQAEAIQVAISVLLPSVFLSGFIFPINSLPEPLQLVSPIIPATHFIRIARGIIIRGATLDDLWSPVLALVIISMVLIALSARAFKKTMG